MCIQLKNIKIHTKFCKHFNRWQCVCISNTDIILHVGRIKYMYIHIYKCLYMYLYSFIILFHVTIVLLSLFICILCIKCTYNCNYCYNCCKPMLFFCYGINNCMYECVKHIICKCIVARSHKNL